jgi:uncharacterized protein YbjT (DUF2867 family)
VFVAGATGFVGRNLRGALQEAGHTVRCGSRNPDRARSSAPGFDWVEMDVDRPETIRPALEGCDAAVYLIHAMGEHDDPMPTERQEATAFLQACEDAGIQRIVYLGGPAPDGEPSPHLASRLMTGHILRSGTPSTIELRAAMIIGNGSESWLICRDLAMRLPVMILPSWLSSRSQPIWIGDVVAALTAAVDLEHEGSAAYDLPGPDTLSARQILEGIAASRGMKPIMIPVPVLTPKLSSYWLRGVTRANFDIAKQLVEGLEHDLVSKDDGFWALVPDLERTPFERAVELAFEQEEPPATRRGRLWERLTSRLARSGAARTA